MTYNVERRDIKYKISRPRVAIDVAADKDRLQTARQTSDILKNGAAQRGKAQKKRKEKRNDINNIACFAVMVYQTSPALLAFSSAVYPSFWCLYMLFPNAA